MENEQERETNQRQARAIGVERREYNRVRPVHSLDGDSGEGTPCLETVNTAVRMYPMVMGFRIHNHVFSHVLAIRYGQG